MKNKRLSLAPEGMVRKRLADRFTQVGCVPGKPLSGDDPKLMLDRSLSKIFCVVGDENTPRGEHGNQIIRQPRRGLEHTNVLSLQLGFQIQEILIQDYGPTRHRYHYGLHGYQYT